MCGLAGYIGSRIEPDRLQAAADVLLHRGPDGGGIWQDERVGLAHRRLVAAAEAGEEVPASDEIVPGIRDPFKR